MVARTAERAAGRAPRPHRWGWGSADSAAGAVALSERVLSGKPAYGDQKKAGALLAKYTVQIAEALRLEAMKKDLEPVVTAKVYGVAPSRAVVVVDQRFATTVVHRLRDRRPRILRSRRP